MIYNSKTALHNRLLLFLLVLALLSLPSAIGGNFISDGNSVYVNDSNVYIRVTPENRVGSGYISIDLSSKAYTGDINILFGFNRDDFYPTSFEYYNPHFETVTYGFTCDYDLTYQLNPNYFWCSASNGTIMFEHSFDRGNLSSAYAEWDVQEVNDWSKVPADYQKINYDFDNKDTWWWVQGIPITEGVGYKARVWIETKKYSSGDSQISTKYDLGFYPSSYGSDIHSALQNGHLYYIDPFATSTNGLIWFSYLDSTSLIDEVSSNDGTNHGCTTTTIDTNTYIDCGLSDYFTIPSASGNLAGKNFSVCYWMYTEITSLGFASQGTHQATLRFENPNIYRVGGNFFFEDYTPYGSSSNDYVCMVHSGSGVTSASANSFYLNGSQKTPSGSAGTGGTSFDFSGDHVVGEQIAGQSSTYFKGRNYAIYDRALTSAEISSLYADDGDPFLGNFSTPSSDFNFTCAYNSEPYYFFDGFEMLCSSVIQNYSCIAYLEFGNEIVQAVPKRKVLANGDVYNRFVTNDYNVVIEFDRNNLRSDGDLIAHVECFGQNQSSSFVAQIDPQLTQPFYVEDFWVWSSKNITTIVITFFGIIFLLGVIAFLWRNR